MMRRPKKTQFLKLGFLIALIGMIGNVSASDDQDGLNSQTFAQHEWVCDYTRAGDDVLYLRCDDMASLMFDPLIADVEQENTTKYVPIWRKPRSDESAIRLVKAVLCSQSSECRVQMKSFFNADRFANR